MDQGGHALAAALVELGPAGESLIRADLQEGISVPAAVGVEIFELYDLHSQPRVWARIARVSGELVRRSILFEDNHTRVFARGSR